MTTVLVGVDGSEGSEDAVAFGEALAFASGAPMALAMAHSPAPLLARHGARAVEISLREDARATLARLAAPLHGVGDVQLRPVAERSAVKALQEAARQEDAAIIVVGSSHTGRVRRVVPGSTGERLLHGAPCPVAVVPRGYRAHWAAPRPVIGCAYQPTEDGEAALGAAEELALALSASLQVIHVVEPPPRAYDPGELPWELGELEAWITADAARTLSTRVGHLSSRVESDGTLYIGRPADVLIGQSETVDLLVVGSRGYGPLKSVLRGGVSGRVIRAAGCPVVVVPQRAPSAVGSLFASALVRRDDAGSKASLRTYPWSDDSAAVPEMSSRIPSV
jgi:nucleotide-binding universal stress UspA family protein